MRAKWYAHSSATCWLASNVTGCRCISFPTEKLAREYVDFKNQQEHGAT